MTNFKISGEQRDDLMISLQLLGTQGYTRTADHFISMLQSLPPDPAPVCPRCEGSGRFLSEQFVIRCPCQKDAPTPTVKENLTVQDGHVAGEVHKNHIEIFCEIIKTSLQLAWDDHVGDTGCFPDDFDLKKRELGFTAGSFSDHAARLAFNTPYMKSVYACTVAQKPAATEYGWLIELTNPVRKEGHILPLYISLFFCNETGHALRHSTTDHEVALRFARKIDAYLFIQKEGLADFGWSAVEHGWIPTQKPAVECGERLAGALRDLKSKLETGPTSKSVIMQAWDSARNHLASYPGGTFPREVFEGVIDDLVSEIEDTLKEYETARKCEKNAQ